MLWPRNKSHTRPALGRRRRDRGGHVTTDRYRYNFCKPSGRSWTNNSSAPSQRPSIIFGSTNLCAVTIPSTKRLHYHRRPSRHAAHSAGQPHGCVRVIHRLHLYPLTKPPIAPRSQALPWAALAQLRIPCSRLGVFLQRSKWWVPVRSWPPCSALGRLFARGELRYTDGHYVRRWVGCSLAVSFVTPVPCLRVTRDRDDCRPA